jgi:CDP-4-dehydro-6-deoxyglucose reductase
VVSQETDLWQGRTGLVSEAVTADIAQLNAFKIFVSGSPAMVYGTLDHFVGNGFQPEKMQSDVFSYAPRPQ